MNLALPLALVLPWVVIVFLGGMIFLLLRQHGQALLNQDELRNRLTNLESNLQTLSLDLNNLRNAAPAVPQAPPARSGLEIGSPAPEFKLPDIEGRDRTLQDFLGKPLLVVFWSTGCGFCQQMSPRLADLPEDGPRVLLISRGEAEEHRQWAERDKWKPDVVKVVLEEGWDITSAYQSGGTPTGYLLDAEGRVSSSLAIGAEALLQLVQAVPTPGGANGQSNGLTGETVAVSAAADGAGGPRRHGVGPGEPAPDFSLPDLDGSQRTLSEFRGKKVLLVFSDPECVPCQPLAKELARRHRRQRGNGLEMVIVSRGEPGVNREKAREHGVDFPILLQSQWEVSKSYGMFATPVAYLIDEQGTISKEAAVGNEAILELA